VFQGIAARVPFDTIIAHVAASGGVVYEVDRAGGISGWRCRSKPRGPVTLLCNTWRMVQLRSAQASRHSCGRIPARGRVVAFMPDYWLTPEHPFSAADQEERACFSFDRARLLEYRHLRVGAGLGRPSFSKSAPDSTGRRRSSGRWRFSSALTVAQYLRDTWPMVRRNTSDCPGLRIALLSGDVWISCSRNSASSPRRSASYRDMPHCLAIRFSFQ